MQQPHHFFSPLVRAQRYFGHWSNWIDIAVIVMVMVTLVVYMHSVHRAKHGQATLEEVCVWVDHPFLAESCDSTVHSSRS